MEEYYIGQIFEGTRYPANAAVWCNAHNAHIARISATKWQITENAKPEPTIQDYDYELESYCKEVRDERGWTTTDPRMSIGSKVDRWNQDGIDYKEFRDNVLLYGLQVENDFLDGKPVPSLKEFKTELRKIKCNWTYEAVQ